MYQQIVALGDSILAGTGDPIGGLAHLSFAEWFADSLRAVTPDVHFTNFAQHGATLDDILYVQLPAALELNPDLVLLAGGANDALAFEWDFDHIQDQLGTLFEAFYQRDTALVTFSYVNIVAILGDQVSPWVRRINRRIDRINEVIRDLSADYETVFVDFWHNPDWTPAECWSEDGMHPNALGHLRAARPLIAEFATQTRLVLQVPTERYAIRQM